MLQHEQDTTLIIGSPSVFGDNSFFNDHALGRPAAVPGKFRLTVAPCEVRGFSDAGNVIIKPASVEHAILKSGENLSIYGCEADRVNQAGSVLWRDKVVYVPILQSWQQVYGHWIVDILPNAVVARNLVAGGRVALLYTGNIPEFGFQLAERFGFSRADVVHINDLDRSVLQHVVLISRMRDHDYFNATMMGRYFTRAVADVPIDRDPESAQADKLYVSRREWKDISFNSRSLINRDDVEDLFRSSGYSIISPEAMSIDEQIRLFRGARIVAGESGSGLHNSIFMNKNAKVIAIQSGRQNHLIQASLCSIFGQASTYVVGQQDNDEWDSNFVVDIDDVRQAIASEG
jgi:capsular polysaccharide biosynthesis protein